MLIACIYVREMINSYSSHFFSPAPSQSDHPIGTGAGDPVPPAEQHWDYQLRVLRLEMQGRVLVLAASEQAVRSPIPRLPQHRGW